MATTRVEHDAISGQVWGRQFMSFSSDSEAPGLTNTELCTLGISQSWLLWFPPQSEKFRRHKMDFLLLLCYITLHKHWDDVDFRNLRLMDAEDCWEFHGTATPSNFLHVDFPVPLAWSSVVYGGEVRVHRWSVLTPRDKAAIVSIWVWNVSGFLSWRKLNQTSNWL